MRMNIGNRRYSILPYQVVVMTELSLERQIDNNDLKD
jgi:hypothetical protein